MINFNTISDVKYNDDIINKVMYENELLWERKPIGGSVGDFCLLNKTNNTFLFVNPDNLNTTNYPTSKYILCGLVITPSKFNLYGNGKTGVFSFWGRIEGYYKDIFDMSDYKPKTNIICNPNYQNLSVEDTTVMSISDFIESLYDKYGRIQYEEISFDLDYNKYPKIGLIDIYNNKRCYLHAWDYKKICNVIPTTYDENNNLNKYVFNEKFKNDKSILNLDFDYYHLKDSNSLNPFNLDTDRNANLEWHTPTFGEALAAVVPLQNVQKYLNTIIEYGISEYFLESLHYNDFVCSIYSISSGGEPVYDNLLSIYNNTIQLYHDGGDFMENFIMLI